MQESDQGGTIGQRRTIMRKIVCLLILVAGGILLAPKKLPVCHNGKEIWVSVQALTAHLAHGDCFGGCDVGCE